MTSEPTEPEEAHVVPPYARVGVIGGAIMIFIAGLVWVGSIELEVGKIVNFGPGAIPKILALVLFVSGVAILLKGLFLRGEAAEAITVVYRPPLVLGLAIFLFALFIRGGDFGFFSTPRLGLMVVGPMTVFIAGFATPTARAKELAIMAFGLTAAMIVVFPGLLGVRIPVFPKFIENAVPPSFGVETAIMVLAAIWAVIAVGLYYFFYKLPETRRD